MSSAPLVKIRVPAASQVCANFKLDQAARQLLRNDMAPREFVETLVANGQYLSAIEFIAYALPAREAIWWGCLSLQHACGDDWTPEEKAACKAAVQWVLEPNEDNRAAAKQPAEAAGPGSAAGALATAANHTGGSLAPPNMPVVPPGPFAPALAVANAVKFASLKGDPLKTGERQRAYVALGIEIAEGRFL